MVASLLVTITGSSCLAIPAPLKTEPPCGVAGLAPVPAGWFLMGEDDGRSSNEPRHPVYLDS